MRKHLQVMYVLEVLVKSWCTDLQVEQKRPSQRRLLWKDKAALEICGE